MASTAMNIPQPSQPPYISIPQPMRSEYLMSTGQADLAFPFRGRYTDQSKNYVLKRDVLVNHLKALSIRSVSPHRSDAGSASGSEANSPQKINSSRYKTELCRPFEEQGICKYREKCQFAHGISELRSLARHRKYKTERCRTYHSVGLCPYGPRCHFVHEEEPRTPPSPKPSPTKQPPRVPLEQIANSSAFRNLFAYGAYPSLSVSLGSAGEYSPANSLSTSPVLSPTYSEETPVQHLASPVWPVAPAEMPRPQQVPREHFVESRTQYTSVDSYPYPFAMQTYSTNSSDCISNEQAYGAIDSSTEYRLPIFRRLSVENN